MSRAECISYTPGDIEAKAIVERLQPRLDRPLPTTGGRCEACNKALEDSETGIRGYASGNELGLCRKCASHVNTEQAINYAEKLGVQPKSRVIYSPAKASADGGVGYNEGGYE